MPRIVAALGALAAVAATASEARAQTDRAVAFGDTIQVRNADLVDRH